MLRLRLSWLHAQRSPPTASLTKGQLGEAQRLRLEQAQPYVAVFTESSGNDALQIDLVIKNFGATAATDVRVKIDPPPRSANLRHSNVESYLKVPEVIPVLVPVQAWRCYWDFTKALAEAEDLPREYTATVSFKDSQRKPIEPMYTFLIDWGTLFDQNRLTIHNLHDLAGATMDIRDVLKDANSRDGLKVSARDGDRLHKRERRFWRGRSRAHKVEAGTANRVEKAAVSGVETWSRLKRRIRG
ncbi:MAG: hypothetical protein M3Y55_18045 [Pseudomonadota bacterium]|nr:hypothetical protein [Pseudomonadota bacterium]